MRQKIELLEAEMLQAPQLDIPVKHYFSQGVYAREITIPAGTLLTGKIHKYEQLNILSKGEISVLTDDGVKRVCAPFTIVSPPGTKRIAIAHSECVWTTIHGTAGLKLCELDLAEIEDTFIAKSDADYLEHRRMLEGEVLCLG
jgi:hypothetical protein